MKTKIGIWIYGIISVALFSLAGCKEEYKTTTKINRDGSCERIIVAKVDSSRIMNGKFLVPHDKSWDLQYKTLGADTQKVFIVHKKFDDVNQLNEEYKGKNKVGVEIKFDKKFRWFFTYLTYKEEYKTYNRFNRIPLKSFLSQEEYNKLGTEDTNKSLKNRLDQFVEENILEEFYQQFIENVREEKDSLLLNMLVSKKRELKDSLVAGPGNSDSIIRSLQKVLGSKKVALYKENIDRIMKNINSDLEQMSGIDGEYTNEVIMPGIILNTNASTLEGNKATWKFNQDKFAYIDYVMIVESRVSNIWTVYITGGVIVVVIGLLLLPKFRKNKMKN
ncbi:MAG: hypothetical protein NTX65_08020 [Ignavibacteriales bacterium]|nr:hypothetical protein [Ignavibacteriales bacterium]